MAPIVAGAEAGLPQNSLPVRCVAQTGSLPCRGLANRRYVGCSAGVLACEFTGRLAPCPFERRDAARTRRRDGYATLFLRQFLDAHIAERHRAVIALEKDRARLVHVLVDLRSG